MSKYGIINLNDDGTCELLLTLLNLHGSDSGSDSSYSDSDSGSDSNNVK